MAETENSRPAQLDGGRQAWTFLIAATVIEAIIYGTTDALSGGRRLYIGYSIGN